MRDRITLLVDNKKIEHFLGYSIEADLYQAADAFSIQLANPDLAITPGSRCQLLVNDQLELTGIIDKVIPGYDKSGRKLTLEGRDLMGLLVDSYCEEFFTLKGGTLKSLAERLLKNVPFVNRKGIIYQQNLHSGLKKKKKDTSTVSLLDTPQQYSQIEAGMRVFDVLRDYAANRGLLFYSLPDGTFVFGKPVSSGEAPFVLTSRKDGTGNNVKEATLYRDISQAWSKITVIGQQQGREEFGQFGAAQIRTRATEYAPEVPIYKPLVAKNNNDSQSPASHARALRDKQRHDSLQYFVKVAGYSQHGRNWAINQLCRVKDEIVGLDGVYLIYNRVLELHRDEGPITWLKLGLPGVVA